MNDPNLADGFDSIIRKPEPVNGLVRHKERLLTCLLLLPFGTSMAEDVYKCVAANGATSFTSRIDPQKNCKPIDLKVIQPNPDDVARTLEKNRQKEEDDNIAEQEKRERQAARAQVLEAEAAMRRARAAEEENRLLRQQQLNGGYAPAYPADGNLYPYPIYPPHYPPLLPHPPMPPPGDSRPQRPQDPLHRE